MELKLKFDKKYDVHWTVLGPYNVRNRNYNFFTTKLSNLESFKAIKLSNLEAFTVLKLSKLKSFSPKISNLVTLGP